MKILVTTDGSESSEKAIEFASKLAKSCNLGMVIAHVIPSIYGTKEDILILIKEEIGNPEKAGRKYLAKGKEIASKYGVEAEVKLLKGDIIDVILKEAEKGYDFLVVGYHGRRKINELLMGSIANKILKLSKIPVLIVK